MGLRARVATAALFFVLFASIGVAYLANQGPSIERVLVSEGGYTNDREDPGGCTNLGITIFDTRLYVKKNATCADVKRLTKPTVVPIYGGKYWDALNADALPSGLDYSVFDEGVNSGVARAGRVLRQLLGLPTHDWHVTPEVIDAIKGRAVTALIRQFNAERSAFLHRLKTCPTFCGGWDKRVRSVNAISLQLAAGAAVPLPPAAPTIVAPLPTREKPSPKAASQPHPVQSAPDNSKPIPPPPKTWWERFLERLPENPFVRWTPLLPQPGPGKAI
jgi:lysozyme family protein